MIYGREALRKYREERANVEEQQEREANLLSRIPALAAMDNATLCVWNGERFIAWGQWMITRPVLTDDVPPEEKETRKQSAPVAGPGPHVSNDQERLW